MARGTKGGSAGLHVQFYKGSVQDPAESAVQGRPVFKDVPFVRIAVPGDKDNIVDVPAWVSDSPDAEGAHNQRFPEEYAHYLSAQTSEIASGTPLREWPQVTRSQVDELAYQNVRTVEQLASVSDSNLTKMGMGMGALRQKAQDFLQAAKEAAPAAALAAELHKRDALIAQMQAQLAALTEAQSAAAPKPQPRTGK